MFLKGLYSRLAFNNLLNLLLILNLFFFFSFESCNSPNAPKGNNPPDTTSNNFSFQTFTFGASNAGSSYLLDVAIVNDTDIWCVGAVYLDSADGAPDPNAYNAVHWDGSKWNLKRIYYYGSCSVVKYPPLKSIYVFSDNRIVVTNGGSIGWVNGDSVKLDCGVNPLLSGAINKIWGESSDNFYIVGNASSIVRYQNGTWQKIASGTTTDIYDIWGTINNSETIVLYTGYQEIYSLTANGISKRIDIPLNRRIRSVWFKSNYKIYAAGDGIFSSIDMINWKEENISDEYATFRIRGSDINNIWATGGFGFTAHFNGAEWTTISEAALTSGNYLSLAVNKDIVVLVGSDGRSAIITVGEKK